jgi:molybdopterin-guanine dinucleotide biosynthesis protein A
MGKNDNLITIAILAGGLSRRMGCDKAFQPFNGTTLLETVLSRLFALDMPLLIVTSSQLQDRIANVVPDCRVVSDRRRGAGAMGAIYTALIECATPNIFVTGCDMPFLNIDLIRHMCNLLPGYNAVTPVLHGMTEPLHSIYSQTCRVSIEHLLQEDTLKVSRIFSMVDTRYVGDHEISNYDPNHESFININTPEDLENTRSTGDKGQTAGTIERHAAAVGATV